MAQAVIMPRQGQSVESCILTEIMRKVGDTVKVGDILFACETDKATFEVEAETEGTMLKWLAEEGDDVPVLQNVCVIGQAGEDISEFVSVDAAEPKTKTEEPVQVEETKPQVEALTSTATTGNTLKVSPRAKHAAQNQNVDLSKAVPTGPYGRIIERDIALAASRGDLESTSSMAQTAVAPLGASSAGFVDEKLTNVRKVIAKAMHASLADMAQLTLNTSFDASALMDFRAQVKKTGPAMGLNNITLNDMILFAAAKTLKKHKACNAHFLGDKMRYFDAVNLGIAVDTDRGLLVPTVFSADSFSLNDLSSATKQTIEQAKSGSISPDLLKDGTFTVTNLGALGVESFTPVINPPQTCILGVCTIIDKVKLVDGQMTTYPSMGLSLTFDHRALDGAPAAKFLKDLTDSLESFSLLLI